MSFQACPLAAFVQCLPESPRVPAKSIVCTQPTLQPSCRSKMVRVGAELHKPVLYQLFSTQMSLGFSEVSNSSLGYPSPTPRANQALATSADLERCHRGEALLQVSLDGGLARHRASENCPRPATPRGHPLWKGFWGPCRCCGWHRRVQRCRRSL